MRQSVGLTPRQQECLAAIKRHVREQGTMPRLADLAEALGLSSRSAVHGLLMDLEERGAIRRLRGRPRAIRIASACPHCGGELL